MNSSYNKLSNDICLGTWKMGGDVTPNPLNDDERDVEAIQYAISQGITHIDTSESYAGGKAEILVGQATKAFKRNEFFIATKVREYNLNYQNLINSCKNSLIRLNLDYIDLFYIHKQNPSISIEETCKALNYLLEVGLVRNIGLSNVGISTISKFQKLIVKPIFAVQNQLNLVCRESQKKGVISYCKSEGIKFIAWRPILLSFPGATDPNYSKGTFEIIDYLSEKYNKTNTQIVARWVMQHENVSLLFKSSNKTHIDEILDCQNFFLSSSDWELLDVSFPVQKVLGCTADMYYELQ